MEQVNKIKAAVAAALGLLTGLVCPVVLVWYIVTELGSMIENAVVMGAPAPKWLVKLLALSKDAADKLTETEYTELTEMLSKE